MPGDRAAHHEDVVAFEQASSFVDGVRDDWGNIATNVQQDLLKNGGVQSCGGDADFVQSMCIADRGFCKLDAFASW